MFEESKILTIRVRVNARMRVRKVRVRDRVMMWTRVWVCVIMRT